MYLKVKTSALTGGWRMYEAANVQWHYYTWNEFQKMIGEHIPCQDVSYHDFTNTGIEQSPHVAMVTFFDGDEAIELYTVNDVFLLNNDGRTIERIH